MKRFRNWVEASWRNRPWRKATTRQLAMEHLERVGYTPDVDGAGNIVFKDEGDLRVMSFLPDDPTYVQMFHLVDFSGVDDPTSFDPAIHETNSRLKIGKIFRSETVLVVSTDTRVKSAREFEEFFERGRCIIRDGLNFFYTCVRQ